MTFIPVLPPPRGPAAVPDFTAADTRLWDAAQKIEATFLAEMLKSAGFGANKSGFDGGIGEDQFSSFLLQAQANEMTKTGGIGLAESVYHALKLRADV